MKILPFKRLFKVEIEHEINIFRGNRHKGFPFQMNLPVSKQVIKTKIIPHRKALKTTSLSLCLSSFYLPLPDESDSTKSWLTHKIFQEIHLCCKTEHSFQAFY